MSPGLNARNNFFHDLSQALRPDTGNPCARNAPKPPGSVRHRPRRLRRNTKLPNPRVNAEPETFARVHFKGATAQSGFSRQTSPDTSAPFPTSQPIPEMQRERPLGEDDVPNSFAQLTKQLAIALLSPLPPFEHRNVEPRLLACDVGNCFSEVSVYCSLEIFTRFQTSIDEVVAET